MADFLLSPEGQNILEDLEFGSASKKVGFKRWYPDQRIAARWTIRRGEVFQGSRKEPLATP